MIKIIDKATELEFELPPDISIPFNFLSPFFEENGSLTYSAEMDANSPTNQRLTGFQNRVGKTENEVKKIPVWLEVFGDRKECTLKVISTTPKIKYNLLFDEGSFISNYGHLTLRDLDLGGNQAIPDPSFGHLPDWDHTIYTKFWPEVKANFPLIYNPDYFNGNELEADYHIDSNFQNICGPKQITAGGLFFERKIFPITPCPFLGYVTSRVFESFGFNISENYLKTDPLNKLILLNTKDTAATEINVVAGVGTFQTYDRTTYNLINHVTETTITKFLKSLRTKFNIFPVINGNKVRLINLDQVLKLPAEEDLSEFSSKIVLDKNNAYTGAFFSNVGVKTPIYTENFLELEDVISKLVLPIIQAGDNSNGVFKQNEITQIEAAVDFDEYWQLQFDGPNYSWNILGNADCANYLVGTSDKVKGFESEFSYTNRFFGEINWLIEGIPEDPAPNIITPDFTFQGNTELLENEDIDTGLNLAFYQGLQNHDGSIVYPYAHYSNAKFGEAFTHILRYFGDGGLIEKHFIRTVDMYLNRGRIYKCKLQLPTYKLFNLDWAEKYKIHGGSFMIKNIKGKFTNTGIKYDSAEIIEV